MQTQENTRVNYRRPWERGCRQRRRKKWKMFRFLALAFVLAFAFHTCEPGQRKRKCKRKVKKKNRFLATTASEVESKMAYWEKILPLRLRMLPFLSLHSTCESRLYLHLHLHLRRKCEPGLN